MKNLTMLLIVALVIIGTLSFLTGYKTGLYRQPVKEKPEIVLPEEIECSYPGDLLIVLKNTPDTIDVGFFNVSQFDTTEKNSHYTFNRGNIIEIITKSYDIRDSLFEAGL